MKVNIVQIGNSKGIRIPQSIIKQCGIEDEVDLEIEKGSLIITPVQKRNYEMKFENISKMEDKDIQLMLRRLDISTLAVAMLSAAEEIKNKVNANLSEETKKILRDKIEEFEKLDAKQLIIEMQKGNINCILADLE